MIRDIKDEWNYLLQDMEGVWSDKSTLLVCILNVFMTLFLLFPSALGFILAGVGWYRHPEKEDKEWMMP